MSNATTCLSFLSALHINKYGDRISTLIDPSRSLRITLVSRFVNSYLLKKVGIWYLEVQIVGNCVFQERKVTIPVDQFI